jgi:Rieske Fe-S protein
LNWFLGTSVGATCVSILYPVVRYISPPDVPEAPTSQVVAGQEGELRPNDAKVFRFGNQPALLIRTPDGGYRAFEATCTHLNCTVQYREDVQQIWCACHNGFYDLTGKVLSGPPPRPLEEYEVKISQGEVFVSKV